LDLKEEETIMALSILTNVESQNAQKNLSRTQKMLAGNFGRLSSGLRINQASDDAAGLAISEKLKSQIRSLSQAERNTNDGISLLQTAEGAMNEVSGILTRMRELAVQSANGTLGTDERGFLNDEFSTLRDEIDRVAATTEFNGINLLDGTASALVFQVGINSGSGDQISVAISDIHASALSGRDAADISSAVGATGALSTIDSAITALSGVRADVGTVQNRLNITVANIQSARENLSAANSRIRDVDVASESAELTKNNILMQAGVAVLAQANQTPSLALSLLR
jgi:flagellin